MTYACAALSARAPPIVKTAMAAIAVKIWRGKITSIWKRLHLKRRALLGNTKRAAAAAVAYCRVTSVRDPNRYGFALSVT